MFTLKLYPEIPITKDFPERERERERERESQFQLMNKTEQYSYLVTTDITFKYFTNFILVPIQARQHRIRPCPHACTTFKTYSAGSDVT